MAATTTTTTTVMKERSRRAAERSRSMERSRSVERKPVAKRLVVEGRRMVEGRRCRGRSMVGRSLIPPTSCGTTSAAKFKFQTIYHLEGRICSDALWELLSMSLTYRSGVNWNRCNRLIQIQMRRATVLTFGLVAPRTAVLRWVLKDPLTPTLVPRR